MAGLNGAARVEETSDETPDDAPLVPQPHGGAIRRGGKRGNRGGVGATPSALRARLRGSALQRIAVLEEVADAVVSLRQVCPKCKYEPEQAAEYDTPPTHSDRVRAVDTLLKHGLHEQTLALSVVQDRIMLTADLLRSALPPELYEAIAPRLRAIWNAT